MFLGWVGSPFGGIELFCERIDINMFRVVANVIVYCFLLTQEECCKKYILVPYYVLLKKKGRREHDDIDAFCINLKKIINRRLTFYVFLANHLFTKFLKLF